MGISSVGNTKIVDDVNGKMSIGQEYDSSKSDYFQGYVWEVILYNYAISSTEYQTLLSSPGRPSSTCTFSQYANLDRTCGNCLPHAPPLDVWIVKFAVYVLMKGVAIALISPRIMRFLHY